MPEQVEISATIEVVQTVPGIKTVHRAVLENYILYWEIRITYNEKVLVSKHYNCPYLEVFGEMAIPDLLRSQDFEKAMFAKATLIDEMPDGPEKTEMTSIIINEIIFTEVL
jgi:hypothetical protein